MVKTITDIEFDAEINDNQAVAIKFFADWCGSCRLIAPKFKKLSEEDTYSGISFIEVNAEKNPLARKFADVKNLPYFAIVKNGALLESLSTAKEEKIIELINKLA